MVLCISQHSSKRCSYKVGFSEIQTVLRQIGGISVVTGDIDPESLGITFCHEHLSIDSKPLSSQIPDPRFRKYSSAPVNLDSLWFINQNPYWNLPNLRLCEENEAVIEELKFLKENGGGTIVENTTIGIERDVQFCHRVAVETGINIIAGTGFYMEIARPNTVNMKEEEMANKMKTDILQGVDGTKIKCGIIGELGCNWPLAESERKCLRAAGSIQSELRCPVMVHPGRDEEAPFEICRIYQEAGGDVCKLVMGHLDRTYQNRDKLLEFASVGTFCEYDLFGIELSVHHNKPSIDMPSDAERIQFIKLLIDEGFEDQITVAHDMHSKHRLMKYGGHGYSHLLLNVVPKMPKRGINQACIDKILKENPKRWLTMGSL